MTKLSDGNGSTNGGAPPGVTTPPTRIALVLGGGGVRAAAHVGVVRALERLGIEIDEIVGTGTGAVVGAGMASGRSASALAGMFAELVEEDHLGLRELKLRLRGARASARHKGEKYHAFLRRHFPAGEFGDLRRPFFCNALSLSTGRTRYFGLPGADRVAVADAVYASSCLPGLFEPLELDGECYVDGGMAESLALRVADTRQFDLILAVDLSRLDPHRVAPPPMDPTAVLSRSYEILSGVLSEHALHRYAGRGDFILIKPDLRDVAMSDLDNLDDVVALGERETHAALLTHPKTRFWCDPDLVKAVDRQVSQPRDYVHLDVDTDACINCGVCAATCATEGYAAVPFGRVVRKLHHYECTRDGACERACPTRAITSALSLSRQGFPSGSRQDFLPVGGQRLWGRSGPHYTPPRKCRSSGGACKDRARLKTRWCGP